MTNIRTRIPHGAIEEIPRRHNATLWYGYDPDIETVRQAAAYRREIGEQEMAGELEALIARTQEERASLVHERLNGEVIR